MQHASSWVASKAWRALKKQQLASASYRGVISAGAGSAAKIGEGAVSELMA